MFWAGHKIGHRVSYEQYTFFFFFSSGKCKINICLLFSLDEKSNEIDLSASEDWDVKTITSALKLYLR